MGIFLVSGTRKSVTNDMASIQAKKKKMPNLKWHIMERKACAMMNVKSIFTNTVTLCPSDLASSGNVSLGISHPSGAQDHAKEDTNVHTITTTNTANPWFKLSE